MTSTICPQSSAGFTNVISMSGGGTISGVFGDIFARIRRDRHPHEASTTNPFKLESSVEGPAAPGEIKGAWGARDLPDDAIELWTVCRKARLFEDVEYGQWGLVLLSPSESALRTSQERECRANDLKSDDIVIGAFLGDQDLLILAPSEAGDRRVLIALPLDERNDWFGVAPSLVKFLERYLAGVGDKYWESKL